MNNWAAEAWRGVVESAPEGIVICDATSADCPVVFVNAAFVQMCGYPAAALLGTNLRILQASDRDQDARVRLADAVSKGEPARVLVRNYRPDGSMFWNETVIQPVRTEKFDRSAGDACIRRVSRVIGASYRRGGDLVGRWEGGTFAVLTQGEATEKATQYAQVVRDRVRALLMHHPTAGAGRYVTMSAGIASLVPPRTLPLAGLLKACQSALRRAKKNGKDATITAEAADFQDLQLPATATASPKPSAASTTTE